MSAHPGESRPSPFLNRRFLPALLAALSLFLVAANLTGSALVAAVKAKGSRSEHAATAIVTVSAASFDAPVAAESIVAMFGADLATSTVIGGTIPLPLSLGGTTVMVQDSLGIDRPAGLFFVSPQQINCVIPAGTASGLATVRVVNGNGVESTGTVEIAVTAPGVFTASSDSHGVPAANVIHVFPDFSQSLETAFQGTPGNFTPRPIDLGPPTEQVFLILYLTGMRNAPNTDGNAENGVAESVRVLIGGLELTPAYAGVAPGFAALDQINLFIDRGLIGRGLINASVVVLGGGSSNLVDVNIASPAGGVPPTVTGVAGPANLLAHDLITLTGTMFSPDASENTVRIGGIEAGVEVASTTQLQARVQFGTPTGPISVATSGGQWTSPAAQPVRTSMSGLVRDTLDQPIAGAKVTLVGGAKQVQTQPEGWYVLPDTPTGSAISFRVEVPSSDPIPYPSLPLKMPVVGLRDNPYPGTVYLQQASGPEITIGNGSGGSFSGVTASRAAAGTADPVISVDGVSLTLPGAGLTAIFPGGESQGNLVLDVLKNSLTPAPMPAAIFSSSVAQISPFGVALTPGAKLTFPNLDGFPSNAQLKLFKFDLRPDSPTVGTFIDTGRSAFVSANGNVIDTEPDAVTETSYYFVAAVRPLTTITGRVVDSDGTTPRRGAIVRARGQETQTDGNGGFVLRRVPAKAGDNILVAASLLRPNGRVDRAVKPSQAAEIQGITHAGTLVLSSSTSNRAPLIYVKSTIQTYADRTVNIPVAVVDLDENLEDVTLAGPSFAELSKTQLPATYQLRLAPRADQAGNYVLAITALDKAGLSTRREVNLIVKALPTALPRAIQTNEDQAATVVLAGTDPENRPLTFKLDVAPRNGQLSGVAPNITYKPNHDFNGQDSFTYVVDNGLVESNPATVSITVLPVNDAPVMVVPGSQTADVNRALSFNVSATDPDASQTLTLTAENLPTGAQFNQTGPAAGTFSWTPTEAQVGIRTITFTVRDNAPSPLSDSKSVTITVAGLGVWRPTSGPDGGTITALTIVDGVLLAGTEGDGVFRSVDNGSSWTRSNSPPGNGFITSFTTLQSPGVTAVYVGTGTGIYRSLDGGREWVALNGGLTNLDVTSLTSAVGTIFAGTNGGGVFRFSTVNSTWSAVNTNLSNLSISALTSVGELVYAANAVGVFSSVSGQSWSNFNTGLPNARVVCFGLRQTQNGTTIFAGTQGAGVYQRALGASVWSAFNIGLTNPAVNALAVGPGNLQMLAGTTGGGVFRYDFSAPTPAWAQANSGLTNPIVRSVLAGAQTSFAGTQEGGVFRTIDNASPWTAVNNGLPRARVTYLLSNQSALYAGTNGGGVYVSLNNGNTWTGINSGLQNLFISSLVLGDSTLYASTVGGGVYRSQNGGASWSAANNGLGNLLIQSLGINGNALFAGTEAGTVWVSTNGATSWTPASTGLGQSAVYSITALNGFTFVGTNGGGIFRSANNGSSWTPVNSGLGSSRVSCFASSGNTLFAGTLDAGVYRSTDNGVTWSPANNGLTRSDIYALLLNGTRLYAATNGGGVFVSSDPGNNWTPANQGLVFPFVLALAANSAGTFAGTNGGGVFILD